MTTARPACWWCYAFYYIEETAPRAQVQDFFSVCRRDYNRNEKWANSDDHDEILQCSSLLVFLFFIFGAHAERYNIREELLVDIELEQRKKWMEDAQHRDKLFRTMRKVVDQWTNFFFRLLSAALGRFWSFLADILSVFFFYTYTYRRGGGGSQRRAALCCAVCLPRPVCKLLLWYFFFHRVSTL